MSYKHLFSRSLGAAPGRLHVAAHSHHLWPDASFAGQVECWDDAARLADRKWERVMGELWPEAQAEVAAELRTGQPGSIVFAGNTHDFIVRLWAAAPRRAGTPLRVLTTSGEFHSARRQFARWAESGDIRLEVLPPEPHDTLAGRLAERAGEADLIMVSQLMFGTGRMVPGLDALASVAAPDGPWVVIDGYHSFMAVPEPLGALGRSCFFLAGGYKYAMSGEGIGLMHCPPGFGPRPPITGWYAEFEDLTLPPGQVGYAPDAMRFMGATFDPSALYRFLHIRRMLAGEGLSTARISAHVDALKQRLAAGLAGTVLDTAELLDPPSGPARFLALRHARAPEWQAALLAQDCITDVRGDVLRIGLGLYHDDEDVDRVVALAKTLD
ncbi:selenocysteine lyase/cysteine desulfurase [Sphingomonas kaistensis]|uniref:Selenocysteine lyase/cysteine desulfurase n=1 Tax=Sphingomonas kaistensis TaxID=298708 RepID=A0A7X5Y424_9SPHN|nr:class V aminotransferase [Sphingomonas kaistensis]NJC04789.1 selenocysteine lyase/cysteine desulfurase [Sphingomonas kaistensis]